MDPDEDNSYTIYLKSETPSDMDTLSVENIDLNQSSEELTKKFLSGELSFDEYSKEWNENSDSDRDDEESSDVKDTVEKAGDEPTKKRRNTNRTKLSPALLGLMGEANLRFVKGDKATAERICYEIIRQVPNSPEPYQTLAEIYENDTDLSYKFSLLAANLSNIDAEEWLRLAEYPESKGDYKQMMTCYTKALKAQPENLDLHLKRIRFLEKLDEICYPTNTLNCSLVKCYFNIVKRIPASQPDVILKYTKLYVIACHKTDPEKSLEILEIAFAKCSEFFQDEEINIYTDLLLSMGKFDKCLELFVVKKGVEIEADIITTSNEGILEEHIQYVKCKMPDDLPIDLKTKVLICFIQLKALNVAIELLEIFLKYDVEKAGDLFLDIEEALTAINQHEAALRILEILVQSSSYNLPGVWLKYADCLAKLGKREDAIIAYKNVIHNAPHLGDVRIKLVSIIGDRGCIDDTLQVLQQDLSTSIDHKVLNEYYQLVKKQGKLEECLQIGEVLLSTSFFKFYDQEEYKFCKSRKSFNEHIPVMRKQRGLRIDKNWPHIIPETIIEFSPEQEWSILGDLLLIAKTLKRHDVLQRLAFSALGSKKLQSYRNDLELICVQAAILNKDTSNCYYMLRDIFLKHNEFPSALNFAYLCSNITKDHRVEQFILRYLKQQPNHKLNNCIDLICGNKGKICSKTSIKHYMQYFSKTNDALTALLLGATFLPISTMRTTSNNQKVMLYGLYFLLKYKALRGCEQEVNFNIGRAYHHLRMFDVAISYYEKVLSEEDSSHVCEKHPFLNLKREAAYNMYSLYKKQSPKLALMYLEKYIVI